MSSIAIITARGGSKRIPKKNIKDFLGKPIIAYSIEAALNSEIFDEVMVSTDSEEIANIAKSYGASVPFMRSADTSNDYATTADVISEVLNNYNAEGRVFDDFTCIYPTAPFITADKLKNAYKIFNQFKADSLVPVVRFSFPPQRGFVCKDGFIKYQYPEFAFSRSQDLEPIYHDCGQFYICKSEKFLEKKSLVMDKTVPFIIPETEVQDIDTETDWIIAEEKYRNLYFN
ncbi:MAG: pseudaminic acid cytidylyltransferase [Eubacterium sp.]|nr:pseudaminic acid cytidylyltransferase [Eubacterium sp.]